MTDLMELAKRVEAGDADNSDIAVALRVVPSDAADWAKDWEGPFRRLSKTKVCLVHSDGTNGVNWTVPRFKTSLDAAKSLHDAVLPGWHVRLSNRGDKDGDARISETSENGVPEHYGYSSNGTAAAWVAAILRAKNQTSVKGSKSDA